MSLKRLYLRILQLVSPAPLFPEPFSKTSSFSCPSDSVKLLSANFIAFSFIVTWYLPIETIAWSFFLFFITSWYSPLRQLHSPFSFLHYLSLSLLVYLSHKPQLPYNVSIHYYFYYSTYQVWPSDHWYCCQMVLKAVGN